MGSLPEHHITARAGVGDAECPVGHTEIEIARAVALDRLLLDHTLETLVWAFGEHHRVVG